MAAGILVAGSLLTASCARPGGPGVDVKTVASDIVFNAEAPEPEAVPTLALPPSADGGFEDFDDEGDETVEEEAPEPTVRTRPPVTVPPGPSRPACPEALATAFPRDASTFDVPRAPAGGEYRWKRTISNPVAGTKNMASVTVFTRRQLLNVSSVTSTPNPQTPERPTRTFTFEDAALFIQGSAVTTYQVKDNAPQQSVGGATSVSGNSVDTQRKATAGAPDRGVAITGSVIRDSSGKQVGVAFKPSTPVLVLPVPVAVPTDFESVGVDPTTGSSLAIRGTVVGKDRIDACGDVVDGWKVVSTQTFTASDGRQSVTDVEYLVATQLGGIVIQQKSSANDTVDSGDPTVTDTLAQLEPTPI